MTAFALFVCKRDLLGEDAETWPAPLPELYEEEPWPVCPCCGERALLLEPLEALAT